MGAWGLAVQVLLPVPLVFLVLLSTPTPHGVKKFIMRICKSTLALPALGVFTVFHFGIFISACAFAVSVRATYMINTRYRSAINFGDMSPNEKTQQLADKWRQERNFWIASMCFLLWIVLSRFYVLNKHVLTLKEQVENLGHQPHPESMDPEEDAASKPSTSTTAAAAAKKTT